ncbi:CHC2 zinc finger domain-containing protein [Luteimonas kalidii]|uniref:CHC2 zinc finger domain-containing protein n=1 Tax=Luteimonas kalidii TaxID=3042025 RepID=A0ABT6JU79_9GAMM|nr:CHC2 zinc finger domain-containing protein [Luteimonas kalidii]MDH5834243.1 CHC2 zinc finger domain-containing protein [Luteimonas kalidii]
MSGRQRRRLPETWRGRLPDAATFYRQHVDGLCRPNGEGWAKGKCPFHDDSNASLSVHIASARGGWKCFAGCGQGDMVSFRMRRTGEDFRDAAWALIEWKP